MKNKVLLVALICMMLVSFAGCGQGNTPTATEQPTAATASTDPSSTASEPKKEPVEISIALWTLASFDDAIAQKIESDTNIKIKPVELTWDTPEEELQLLAATGELPDLIASYQLDYPQRFFTWIDQGLTRSIPEEIIAQYPKVKELFDNDAAVNAVKELKGGYYYIPRPGSVEGIYKSIQKRFYYRKDWLANLGMKEPTNIDEFYEMLKAFTKNDPDKNNKNDTYGLAVSRVNEIRSIFPMWGIDLDSWVFENDQWIPAFMSQKAIEPLKFFNRMYKEGILDPEFYTRFNSKALYQKLSSGTFGCLFTNADSPNMKKVMIQNFEAANPNLNVYDTVGTLPPLSKTWGQYIDLSGTEVNASVTDEKLKRVFDLYEYLLSPEGKMLTLYGIEGEDYTKKDDGTIEIAKDANGEEVGIYSKYPSLAISFLTDWSWDQEHDLNANVAIAKEIRQMNYDSRQLFNPLALETNLLVRYLYVPSKSEVNLNDIMIEGYTNMIIVDDDIDAAFAKFIEDANNKGVDRVIREVNQLIKVKGIK